MSVSETRPGGDDGRGSIQLNQGAKKGRSKVYTV